MHGDVYFVAQAHPGRVRDMLAYVCLMVREGHKHGGTGWLRYDSIFRKINPGPLAHWDHLDPSLLTIVANQGLAPRLPCHYCQELDHAAQDCALAPLEQQSAGATPLRSTTLSRKGKRPAPYDTTPYSPRYNSFQDPPTGSTRYPTGQRPICISWNRGQCAIPSGCSYAHTCATCNSDTHRARDCPRTPMDSILRKPIQRPTNQ